MVLDLREEEVIYPTNRFMIYALLPAVQHLDPRDVGPEEAEHRARDGQVDRRPLEQTNVGELMLEYGGGGHEAAGTCQVDNDKAERVLAELIERINADG